jgi:type II secretory pathway pseudopilin PulG
MSLPVTPGAPRGQDGNLARVRRASAVGLPGVARRQRGATTLMVALMVLSILVVVALFSAQVAYVERRTTNNENRARLAEHAAEYAINLAGEYIAARRGQLISNLSGTADTGGWLADTAAHGRKWIACSSVAGFPAIPPLSDGSMHPCMTETDATASVDYPSALGAGGRRGQLYFYGTDATSAAASSQLPYQAAMPESIRLETATVGVGGNARLPAQSTVRVLLCRLDISLPVPACRANPAKGNRIAVTYIATVELPGEASRATLKETWVSLGPISASSAVPLVATGQLSTGGTIHIVTNPNAGGYGLPGSLWSAGDAQVENSTGGGNASIGTCYIQDFMRGEGTPDLARAKQMCPTAGNSPPCHCPSAKSLGDHWLSGSASGARRENIDILDRDGSAGAPGSPRPPDIRFFPGAGPSDVTNPESTPVSLDRQVGSPPNTPASNASAASDDSPFEWIFGVDYVVADHDVAGTTLTNCGSEGSQNCADFALRNELAATVIEGDCAADQFSENSFGLYYVTGNCDMREAQIGSSDAPVIIVVFGNAVLKDTRFFGLLFVHSNDLAVQNIASGYRLDMQNATVFGSLVVEGKMSVTGNTVLVYDDTSLNLDPFKLPTRIRFARLPGSWLDRQKGF